MSTKTTFKRIALVAVASLGFGMLSVVSASAVGTSTGGTMVLSSTTASTLLGTPVALTLSLGATPQTAGTADTAQTATLAQVGAIPAVLAGVITAGTATNGGTITAPTTLIASVAASTASAAAPVVGTFTITFTPTVAGVYRYTLTPAAAGNTTVQNIVITAGYSANSTYPNKAFPTQGSNVTTGWTATAGGQATVRITGFADATTYYVTTDTGSIISRTAGDGATLTNILNTNGTNLAGGFNFLTATPTASDYMDVKVTDLGAASTTVSVKSFSASTGVASTFATATVTWGVSAAATAQYSLLTLNGVTGSVATGAAADILTTTVSRSVSAARKFGIQIVVKDQYNVALSGTIVTASLSGPGTIDLADADAAAGARGRSLSVVTTGSTASVTLWADGTSGTTTVSIYSGTVLLGTKVVTFVGSPTKATATQNLKVAATGTRLGAVPNTDHLINTVATAALTPAFTVSVTDANDKNVAVGSVWKMVSSDSTKIVAGTCAEYVTYPGNFECSVSGAVGALSGASATVTFSVYNAATGLYDIVAAPLTFTVGGAIASTVVTLNKTAYEPGEAMVLTVVSKDSSGNAAYDGQAVYAAISSNKSLGGGLPVITKYIVGGTYASSATAPVVFAPSVDGSFFVAGTTVATATAPYGTAFKIDATVENGVTTTASQAAADAAAEATDAANAATDAANAAAEAADAATAAAQDAADAVAALSTSVTAMVADLRKQITALTNLVIKIQKKVKA